MQWESFQYEILRAVLSHACLTQETGTKMHKNDCVSTVKGGISNSCVTICSHAVPMKISVVCFGFHAFLSCAKANHLVKNLNLKHTAALYK